MPNAQIRKISLFAVIVAILRKKMGKNLSWFTSMNFFVRGGGGGEGDWWTGVYL